MTQWYYQLLGEEFGPVSAASLRQLQTDGTLGNSDQVRSVDSGDWIPLSAVGIDLSADGSAGDAPGDQSDVAQDLSELNFEFEESGAATGAARKQGSAVVERPTGPAQYYYQFFGQTLGPIPLDTLIRMAEAGRLQETDLVRAEEDFLWQAAGEFSELSAAFLLRMPETPAVSAASVAAVAAPVPVPAAPPVPASEVPAPAPAPAAVPASADAEASRGAKLDAGGVGSGGGTGGSGAKSGSAGGGAKAKGGRGRKQARQAEEKLVDNILSEVFAEEEDGESSGQSATAVAAVDAGAGRPAAGPGSSGNAAGGASTAGSVSGVNSAETVSSTAAPAGVRNWGSVSPGLQSSSAAAAAASRPVLRAAPKSKSSSGGSWLPDIRLEFNGPVQALLGLGVLAAIWFGYTPLMRYFKTDEARYISRMELAIETCEKLNPVTEAVKFKGQQDLMKREFGAYVALMTEAGSTRQSAKNCLGALNRLMEFSAVDPQNAVLQKKLLDEAKSLIKKYKG
jgi:hypothetical protein